MMSEWNAVILRDQDLCRGYPRKQEILGVVLANIGYLCIHAILWYLHLYHVMIWSGRLCMWRLRKWKNSDMFWRVWPFHISFDQQVMHLVTVQIVLISCTYPFAQLCQVAKFAQKYEKLKSVVNKWSVVQRFIHFENIIYHLRIWPKQLRKKQNKTKNNNTLITHLKSKQGKSWSCHDLQ